MGHQTEVDPEIRGQARSREIEHAIAALAERQHGVVARAQLVELGLGRKAVDYRVSLGRLHPLHRGVYAVGQRRLPREARWMAAVLGLVPGTAVGHRPAGAHWEIVRWSGLCDVTTPRKTGSRRDIRVHQALLPPDEITVHRGIPVTTVPRTLFDLAAVLPERQLERALNEAEVLRRWDELSLDRLLQRYPRRKGTGAIRAVLHKRRQSATVTRSELEERFLALIDRVGLPRPEINVLIEGFEVDAVWRDARVVVELDGRSTHATVEAFERDRERDRILQVAGWRPIRVTARQLAADTLALVADFRALLGATV
jgi:very-short-patch-repair endonuclease